MLSRVQPAADHGPDQAFFVDHKRGAFFQAEEPLQPESEECNIPGITEQCKGQLMSLRESPVRAWIVLTDANDRCA